MASAGAHGAPADVRSRRRTQLGLDAAQGVLDDGRMLKVFPRSVAWLACGFWLAATATAADPTLSLVGQARQWERLDLRVGSMPSSAKPFADITVDATVQSPSGGSLQIPGFLYQDYQRALAQGAESLAPRGASEWRVRWLPVEVGRHTVTVVVRTNALVFGGPVSLDVDVASASNAPARPGYVRLAANQRYFATDSGTPLPLVGHCVCWYHQRGTYDYDDWFAAMNQGGENYTRIWMAPWAFGIEAEAGAGLNYRLDRAWQLDYVLQLAEQRGIYLLLCLDYHGMFETQPDYWGGGNYWPQNPYNIANGGPCAIQNDFFTSAAAKSMYQKRLRYLIGRYGYSPNLLGWEFFNEIDNEYQYLTPASVAQWHATMGDWLKANDPWHHLVTTSLTGSSDRPEIWSLPQMDFASYHSYGQAQPAANLPKIINSFVSRYRKPVMIGEFGTDWRGWLPEQDPYLRGWRQGIWAGALGGSVGTSMSWWWENIDSGNLYPRYRALRDFAGAGGWGQGIWEPVTFQTNGDPPPTVGNAPAAGESFSVTMNLSPGWGSKLRGTVAVPDPSAGSSAASFLDSFVHGSAHADLRIPFQLSAWLTNDAQLVLHLNSVSSGAILNVRQDGVTLLNRSLPNLDGTWNVNNEYNTNITVALAPGRHTVEIRNTGSDWFYLDWVRLENVLLSEFTGGWQASPVATGLQGAEITLVYVVNPAVSFPGGATNSAVSPLTNGVLRMMGMPAGRFRSLWFNPTNDAPAGETAGISDDTSLVLPLPPFGEDLAGRVERVRDLSLRPGQLGPDHAYQSAVAGETGRVYQVERSADLARWQLLKFVTNASGVAPFIDPGADASSQRFYRAKFDH